MKKPLLLLTGILISTFSFGQETILSEDFSKQQLPAGWLNVDNTGGGVWEFTNPGAREITTTTAANGFAIFDSDNYGDDGAAELAELITPSVNSSAYDSMVNLQFSHYFYDGAIPSTATYATVDVSVDGGDTWTEAALYELVNSGNGDVVDIDITEMVLGQSDVKVRFLFKGSWRYYWAVDDVIITGLIKQGSPPPATPPVAMRDSAKCDTSGSVTINVMENDSAKDYPLDTLSASIISSAKFGNALVLENGLIEYTPIEGYEGLDSFSYTIKDSLNNTSNEAVVVISVEPMDTIVNPPTSIITLEAKTIKLYPNPTSDIIKFDLGSKVSGYTVSIFNYSGKLVHTIHNQNQIGLGNSLPKGLYYLRVETPTQLFGSSFIKH